MTRAVPALQGHVPPAMLVLGMHAGLCDSVQPGSFWTPGFGPGQVELSLVTSVIRARSEQLRDGLLFLSWLRWRLARKLCHASESLHVLVFLHSAGPRKASVRGALRLAGLSAEGM